MAPLFVFVLRHKIVSDSGPAFQSSCFKSVFVLLSLNTKLKFIMFFKRIYKNRRLKMWKYKPYVIVCVLSSHSVKQFLQFSLMIAQFFAVIACQSYDKKH